MSKRKAKNLYTIAANTVLADEFLDYKFYGKSRRLCINVTL